MALTFIKLAPFAVAATEGRDLSSQPLCGVYAVYGAAHISGNDVNFASLLSRDYVSSPRGSSMNDLERAIKAIGLTPQSYSGMTVADLRSASCPIILYVRSSFAEDYDHYILFFRADGDYAIVSDSGRPVTRLAFSELVPYWSGQGIAVLGKHLIPPRLLTWKNVVFSTYLVGIGACFIWGRLIEAYWLPRGSQFARRTGLFQAAILVTVGALIATIAHSLTYGGFLTRAAAVREVEDEYTDAFDNVITLSQLTQLVTRGAIIVDAREPDAFASGHIPGAVNLPLSSVEYPDLSPVVSIRNLRQTIIVYCNGTNCRAAHFVARHLLDNGGKDVRVFRGGFEEWRMSFPDKVAHGNKNGI
jgi:rhodanese-related sulfurtransferase